MAVVTCRLMDWKMSQAATSRFLGKRAPLWKPPPQGGPSKTPIVIREVHIFVTKAVEPEIAQKSKKYSFLLKLNMDSVQMFLQSWKRSFLMPLPRQDAVHLNNGRQAMASCEGALADRSWKACSNGLRHYWFCGQPIQSWTLDWISWHSSGSVYICIQRQVWSICLPTNS